MPHPDAPLARAEAPAPPPPPIPAAPAPGRGISIWWFAFGYFAAYAPYSALTKALSKGLVGGGGPLSGSAMLPASVMVSAAGMLVFLTGMGWWRHAGRRRVFGREVPWPGPWTFLSGLASAAVIGTTTLAYTFSGVSIVFVMLLMRGGVLVLAPLVDALSGRHVRWFSWVGLSLSLAALLVAFSEDGGWAISLACGLDVALYLAAYLVRFRFMSRLAKSEDPHLNLRYFVEEQMIAAPALVAVLGLLALVPADGVFAELRWGFTGIWSHPALVLVLAVGLLSQLTGIFGNLIYLDKRENTYCVPVNRSSSILAGVVASFALTLLLGQAAPSAHQLVGAGLIVLAILVLSLPAVLGRRG